MYSERNLFSLEPFLTNHLQNLNELNAGGMVAVAAELAVRDQQVAKLVTGLLTLLKSVSLDQQVHMEIFVDQLILEAISGDKNRLKYLKLISHL